MNSNTITTTTTSTTVNCDYLVIGAGAASIAFIDTLMTENPSLKIAVIDKKAAPGGHWVDAYGYVKLHQPSLLYGVASRQLEGNWLKLLALHRTLPWNHRATKTELLTHFQKFFDDKIASGQLEFFPNCVYDWEASNESKLEGGVYTFKSLDGSITYKANVALKLVNGTHGECRIPSQTPPTFDVGSAINLMTPNQVYDNHLEQSKSSGLLSGLFGGGKKNANKHYIVLGAGKTAMDAIVYLQETMKVKPDQMSWVRPNDVWILSREEEGGSPWSWPEALLEHNGDRNKAALALEQKNIFTRVDKSYLPTKFKFPVVSRQEMKLLRKVEDVIRFGRVASIDAPSKDSPAVLSFVGNDGATWTSPTNADECIFIHCTSPGPFNAKNVEELFNSEREMGLNLLFAPPISISMSCLGLLEAARMKGTLDLEFGRRLLQAKMGKPGNDDEDEQEEKKEQEPAQESAPIFSDNDVLRELIRGLLLEGEPKEQLSSTITLALFIAVVDKDPCVALKWLKENRLSFFSIPGFKGGVYEQIVRLIENGKNLGFDDSDIRMFQLLEEKLVPIKGE